MGGLTQWCVVVCAVGIVACGDDATTTSSSDGDAVGEVSDATVVTDAQPDGVVDASSDVPPDIAVDVVADVSLDLMADAPSDGTIEDVADVWVDLSPDSPDAADVIEDVAADSSLDAMADTAMDAAAEVTPDAGPETVSDATPDVVPDGGQSACVTGAGDCIGPQFCMASGCGPGLAGVCTYAPEGCDGELPSGTCGCDGETYFNVCAAHQAGVNVAGPGACPEAPVVCQVAESFGLGVGCEVGEYCMGGCSGEGICMKKESGCDDLLEGAVCGCNGNTYPSPCYAASSGVNIDASGPCEGDEPGPDQACGPTIAEPCPQGEHCDISGCAPEQSGICIGIWQGPEIPGLLCLPGDPAECGCDGVTYANKCQRVLAGAAKDYVGACGENLCELGLEDDCGTGLYCAGATGPCSGAGVCMKTNLICLQTGPSVCGCDGKTYTSACHANQKDVPLASLGACP